MIRITTTQLWVHDQDEALAFFTDKVGMEVREDVTRARDGQLPLADRRRGRPVRRRARADGRAGPTGLRRRDPAAIGDLVAKGRGRRVFFATDDCRATFEELTARGVEFSLEPTEPIYGIDAGFRDPSGNSLRLTQVSDDFG